MCAPWYCSLKTPGVTFHDPLPPMTTFLRWVERLIRPQISGNWWVGGWAKNSSGQTACTPFEKTTGSIACLDSLISIRERTSHKRPSSPRAPSSHLSGDNHAEERIPWPMGPAEHSLQDKLDYSSESRIRWLPTGVIRGFLRVRVPLREIKA